MLTSLYPQVQWPKVRCLGFDLDGTLYDEFELARQVYPACLEECREGLRPELLDKAAAFILRRWLEKGSSYPHLFEETFDLYGCEGADRETLVDRALNAYRRFGPRLTLPARSRFILETAAERWPIFLVTDGRVHLQRFKFNALGLGDYFREDHCSFTGALPQGWGKPSPKAYEVLNLSFSGAEVVFFGDREVDRDFAANLGFQFVRVSAMHSR